ncbi:MAG: hypothetical protein RLZZ182_100 [Pseudomonadota bacterium]|jgi:glutathione S-transferase
MSASTFTLYTFAMSHYSEKIRWTLDAARLSYREEVMTPVFHMLPALRMGGRGQTTLPVLEGQGRKMQDSPRILDWLHGQGLLSELIPNAHVAEVRAIEDRFNRIGKDVARLLYARSFGQADEHIVRLWVEHATPWQAAVIRAFYPVIRWGFCRKLNITEAGARRAEQRIAQEVKWLESRLTDGRTYLVGEQLTVADITAAALLAPIACPAEHPVYGDADFREAMKHATAPWRSSPAMAWVRALYQHRRGAMQGGVSLMRQAA